MIDKGHSSERLSSLSERVLHRAVPRTRDRTPADEPVAQSSSRQRVLDILKDIQHPGADTVRATLEGLRD